MTHDSTLPAASQLVRLTPAGEEIGIRVMSEGPPRIYRLTWGRGSLTGTWLDGLFLEAARMESATVLPDNEEGGP
jgi:hypothetical protein